MNGSVKPFGPVKDGTPYEKRAEELAAAIKSLQPYLDQLCDPFRYDPVSGGEPSFDKWYPNDWRGNIFGNALVRLRQLAE